MVNPQARQRWAIYSTTSSQQYMLIGTAGNNHHFLSFIGAELNRWFRWYSPQKPRHLDDHCKQVQSKGAKYQLLCHCFANAKESFSLACTALMRCKVETSIAKHTDSRDSTHRTMLHQSSIIDWFTCSVTHIRPWTSLGRNYLNTFSPLKLRTRLWLDLCVANTLERRSSNMPCRVRMEALSNHIQTGISHSFSDGLTL